LWDKRAALHRCRSVRPITSVDRGRTVLTSLRNSRRLRDLCPICWHCAHAGTPNAPLSRPGQNSSDSVVLYTALAAAGGSAPDWHHNRIDSTIHVHGPRTAHTVTVGTRLSTVCLLHFARCPSLPAHKATSTTADCAQTVDIWFTVLFHHHLDASCKRESRLLCRGTAEPQNLSSSYHPLSRLFGRRQAQSPA
jgi:hypothetical protein